MTFTQAMLHQEQQIRRQRYRRKLRRIATVFFVTAALVFLALVL